MTLVLVRDRRYHQILLSLIAAVLATGSISCFAEHAKKPELSLVSTSAANGELRYVGAHTCISCHQAQGMQWQDSHHAKAMQEANSQTVLADFENATFTKNGFLSRFTRKDGKYFVHTDGHAGKPADYEIRYTFGVSPLQQYLIQLPGGKLQALGIAWDARPKESGGQRWFDLYPDRNLKAGDPLHWSGRDQNWNFMCASCHSTGVNKNYSLSSNTFNTKWTEINVSCEACHGPGSKHVAWMESHPSLGSSDNKDESGLVQPLKAGREITWGFDSPQQRIASPHGKVAAAGIESDNCFFCHARRQELRTAAVPGSPFLDNYLPSLIENGLYHADGQINDEVFEFGSFAQSKMYRAGVTCTNCHEAHSLKLRATDNALCVQCHRATDYDKPEHHHHPISSTGALCVNCHMPHKTYMGVDERRDHGFRIPRPDLTKRLGTPNACTQCHADKSAEWATNAIFQWTGKHPDTTFDFSPGISAAWLGSAAADRLLTALSKQKGQTGIVRASALSLQSGSASKESENNIARSASDPDVLVRIGAARALSTLSQEKSIGIGTRLLSDSVRSVRIEAARALAGTPENLLSPEQKSRLASAVDELIHTELVSAERPESHVNIAQIYFRLGRARDAEHELKTALRLDERFVPAMVNLADLYRATNRDGEGETWLRKAITVAPKQAAPVHAMGLLEIRRGRRTEALSWLSKAVQLDPKDAGYAYIYALALVETGAAEKGLAVVESARKRSPEDASLLQAQISIERGSGKNGAAARHEAELERLINGK